MAQWIARRREVLLLAFVLAAGAALRLYGLNWDGGHWLHPDERQLYFVALDLGWPDSLAQALGPESPLNPGFFAYGSLPIYLLRSVAGLLAPLSPILADPDNLHLVGRPLAVLFDLGTVYLTYRWVRVSGIGYRVSAIGYRGAEGHRGGALVAAALVAFAVLHVQLAHFYTADTLLTFFVLLALNLAADVARGAGRRRLVALGVAVGLALATKVSAAPLLLLIPVALSLQRSAISTHRAPSTTHHVSRITHHASRLALPLAATGVTFFLTQPYALIDAPTFLADTLRESQIAWGALDVPYTRQYAGTLPYVYPIWQTAFWGLGLPLGLAAWAGLAVALVRWLRRGPWTDTLLLAWAGVYFAITGLFHAQYLRYMLPLVPILCIWAVSRQRAAASHQRAAISRQPSAASHQRSWGIRHSSFAIGHWSLVIVSLAYSALFARIYAEPHPWIAASAWIYERVPAGSTLAVEDWDTPLPLPLEVAGRPRRIEAYDLRLLTLYDESDGPAKWQALARDLAAAEYVVIASRRVYGSIPRLPDRYPLATNYYEQLFSGELGYELTQTFSRGPAWFNPRLPPLPNATPGWLRPDESFVVYDHPRTLIFRNVEGLSAAEIFQRVNAP